jgi:hypothetical protein
MSSPESEILRRQLRRGDRPLKVWFTTAEFYGPYHLRSFEKAFSEAGIEAMCVVFGHPHERLNMPSWLSRRRFSDGSSTPDVYVITGGPITSWSSAALQAADQMGVQSIYAQTGTVDERDAYASGPIPTRILATSQTDADALAVLFNNRVQADDIVVYGNPNVVRVRHGPVARRVLVVQPPYRSLPRSVKRAMQDAVKWLGAHGYEVEARCHPRDSTRRIYPPSDRAFELQLSEAEAVITYPGSTAAAVAAVGVPQYSVGLDDRAPPYVVRAAALCTSLDATIRLNLPLDLAHAAVPISDEERLLRIGPNVLDGARDPATHLVETVHSLCAEITHRRFPSNPAAMSPHQPVDLGR